MKYFNTTHLTLHPDVWLDKGQTKTQITAFARSTFRVPDGGVICKRWLALNPGTLRPVQEQKVAEVSKPAAPTNPKLSVTPVTDTEE